MLRTKDRRTISTAINHLLHRLHLQHQKAAAAGALWALVGTATPALAGPPVYSLTVVQVPAGFTVPKQPSGGLNNQGDIAFTAPSTDETITRGFIWRYASRHTTPLGTLGGASSGAAAINDCGDAVGFAALKGGALSHAALFRRGSVIDLDPHGKTTSFAQSINNRGTAVGGSFVVKDNDNHPVIFEKGTVRDLTGKPGQANSINLSDEIAGSNGFTEPNQFIGDAFVIKAGKVTNFRHAPLDSTGAVAINDFGDVLANAVEGDSTASLWFVFQEGHVFDLPLVDAQHQSALAFNNSGDVVGATFTEIPTDLPQAALIREHVVYNLNDLIDPTDPLAKFVSLTQAFGINDSGWIASQGTDSRDSVFHIYLLKRQTPAIRLQRIQGACPATDLVE